MPQSGRRCSSERSGENGSHVAIQPRGLGPRWRPDSLVLSSEVVFDPASAEKPP